MSSASDKPTALRESWRRPDPAGPRGRLRRRLRRYLITLTAAALVLWLAYLLFSPFAHPTTRLFEIAAGPYDPFQVPPLEFATGDAEAVRAPLSRSVLLPGQSPLVQSHVLRSPDDVTQLIAALDGLPATSSDVVLIYLAAHGVTRDGEPYLLCQNFTPTTPDQGSYPLTKLLEQLQLSPAGVKLLILDHGRIDFDPRLGMVVNEFPQRLREVVASLRAPDGQPDTSLWVLSAHSPLERSHVDFASRQSMFGGAVARALDGEGDLDGNQLVTLDELARYVRRDVFQRVLRATNQREQQTPELLGAVDARDAALDRVTLLSVPVRFSGSAEAAMELVGETKMGESLIEDAAATKAQATYAKARTKANLEEAKRKKELAARAVGKGGESPEAGSGGSEGGNSPADSASASSAGSQPTSDNPNAAGDAASGESAPAFPTRETSVADALNYGWHETQQREDESHALGSPALDQPAFWRGWKEQLLAREQAYRFGDPAQEDMLKLALRQDLATLFNPTQLAPRPAASAIARRLALSPLSVTSPTSGSPGASTSSDKTSVALAPSVSNIVATTLPSVTLADLVARSRGETLPEPLAKLLADLDRLLAADDPKAFREWLKQPWPKEADGFQEFQWARQWSDQSTIPWPLLSLAWRVCRFGERLAANPLTSQPWAREQLQLADSWQRAGQREMASRIGPRFAGRAEASLRIALRQYESLESQLDVWLQCDQLRIRALARAPDYLRWFHEAAGDPEISPDAADLHEFLDALDDFHAEMETRRPVLARLIHFRDQLIATERRIRAPLDEARVERWLTSASRPAERLARVELLLRSTLPSASLRERLIEVSSGSSEGADAGTATVEPDPKILNEASWRRAQEDLLLSRKLTRLARLDDVDDAGAFAALEQAWSRVFDDTGRPLTNSATAPDVRQFWLAYRQYGTALRGFYESLPIRIAEGVRRHENLSDLATRDERLRALYALRRAECLLDPRDVTRLGEVSPAAVVRRAAWYDVLRLGHDRALAAIEDAPPLDVESWAEVARRYARATATVPLQPELPPIPERILVWDGPTSVSLMNEPKRDITLTLNYRGRQASQAWIILDYDAELLDARVVGGLPSYDESQLRETAPPGERPYPVRPDVWGRAASFEVATGQPQRLQIALRRRPAPGNQTLVVAKVVCGNQIVRHEIQVRLPATDTLALVPAGSPETWSPTPDGILLHPLANHPIDYRFQLVNLGLTDREVSVEFLPAGQRIPGETPDEFLAMAPDEIMRRSAPGPAVMSMEKLTLRADGKPVLLLGPLPKKDGGGPAPAPLPAAPAPSGASTDGAESKMLEGVDVRHGLLMVVRDLATESVTVRRVLFRPQRPRRFLIAEASYDSLQERLTIRVRPRDPALVPDKGFLVRAWFPVPLPPGTESQLEGVVSGPKYEATLYAAIPAETDRILTVHLDVDQYPRAMTWNVPCGQTVRQIPLDDNLLSVRIVAPDPESAFQAPLESIPVEFEVDAPHGAFESPRDFVEVGVDRRRDRELVDDTTVRLFSDRQVDVRLNAWTPAGDVTFLADVHDFRVTVPTTGLRNVRGDLLAHARVGVRTRWSEPVGVLFDATPPEVAQVELSPGRTVALQTDLEVTVYPNDSQQSGIGKVEVAFDIENKGEFGSATVVPAKSNAAGQWIAKVPVDVPNVGPTRLLVRATDRVGNVGEYTKVPVVVLTPMEAEKEAKNQTNRVTGVVRFSKQLVPKARVELLDPKQKIVESGTTDDQGRFVFPKVPQGKYKLRAKGVSRNRSREIEMDVVVPPPPAQSVQLEVQLSK